MLPQRIQHPVAHPELRRMAFYVAIGCVGALIDLAVFSSLVTMGVDYQVATLCASVVATVFSFLVNRRLNFNVLDNPKRRMALFFVAAFIGYAASALAMWVLVGQAGFSPILARVLCLFLIFAIQYPFNRFITFRTI